MKIHATKHSMGRYASFGLCALLGFICGGTSTITIAVLVSIVVAPLIFSVGARAWMVNLPIALAFGASLCLTYRVIARPPVDADATDKIRRARDASYGALGFGAFYLLAWLGLVRLYLGIAPL